MAITKIQSESLNLADTYAFTGTVTGAGGVMTPAFKASIGAIQTIANSTDTLVNYDSLDGSGGEFDTDSDYDTTNKRFVPSVAGKYFLYAQARTTTTSAFSRLKMQIRKNTTEIARTYVYHGGLTTVWSSVIMAANGSSDYFDVRISQNSGGNIDFENQDYSCFFMGYKIIE